MKKTISALLVVLLCLTAFGCGKEKTPEIDPNGVNVSITNTIENSIQTIGITWYLGNEPVLSSGVQRADGKLLQKETDTFVLPKEAVPEGADLGKLGLLVSITNDKGVSLDVCRMQLPVEIGGAYAFELGLQNDCYTLWQIWDDNKKTEVETPVFEWAGPWHLDADKNDLAAFQTKFPGYGEFGEFMEIGQDGHMTWAIGGETWTGTYYYNLDVLQAELGSDWQKLVLPWTLDIKVEQGTPVLEMPYDNNIIYWTYGKSDRPTGKGPEEA